MNNKEIEEKLFEEFEDNMKQNNIKQPLKIAAFMSGEGTNLRRILELQKDLKNEIFTVVIILSDTYESKAEEIGEEFEIPVLVNDIKEFYAERDQKDLKNMEVREEYDLFFATELEKRKIDLACLCGYMRLVTRAIYQNYNTINIHPADLTKKGPDGKPLYAGAGAACIKKAIQNGEKEVRSSVHLVTGELDGGPVIAVSKPIAIEFQNQQLNDTEMNKKATDIQEDLKRIGDWQIYPYVVELIARGRIEIKEGKIFVDGKFMPNGMRL